MASRDVMRCLLLAAVLVVLHGGARAQVNDTLTASGEIPLVDPNAVTLKEATPAEKKRIQHGIMECPCSPSGNGIPAGAVGVLADVRKDLANLEKLIKGENIGAIFANRTSAVDLIASLAGEFQKCAKEHSWEACVNADKALRGKTPICTYDSTTGKNLILNGTFASEFVSVGPCDKSENFKLKNKGSANEWCVAVEHLQGYVLQHPVHLRRNTLCARGFCATPNHGIVVRGVLTSMKRMCGGGGWKCVERVKWVNNLKISANRRAKVSEDITVTPYDVRFPKAAIWAVQMLEDVWNMLALSVCTGTLAGIAILLISKAETKL